MKKNTQINSTDQIGWVVLFIGTPFMDGRYRDKEDALGVAEAMKERYPRLRFEVAQVRGDFLVSDDIFWANHFDELEVLNNNAPNVYWFRHGYKKANRN
jgi:hypothetical protein